MSTPDAFTAISILQNVFGYDEFRDAQLDIINTLTRGDDALVLMPTGGGKSLCYQIPAMLRDGVGIVVSPLIALMRDQVDALNQLGVRAAFLNSSLRHEEIVSVETKLINRKLDLLYIAPERLLHARSLDLLQRCQIALFAIDEAHCVSQWGHDFRPEYQQLSMLHEQFPEVPRIAVTATADQRTRNEIVSQLDLHDAHQYVSSFDRPNIHYSIIDGTGLRDQMWRFLQREHPKDAGIVYCLSRKKVDDTAQWLSAKGRTALPYHAGLENSVRTEHQRRFLREDGVIIVATIAFGMGIDKPDVRFVAHLNMPKSIEAYYQETGRAGRDGERANAWMAYSLQDIILLRQMASQSDGSEDYKRISSQKLEAMLGMCELSTCRRQTLLAYFGQALNKPCGKCDNCVEPPETWDATVAVQKALSCVYRTEQRFGATYVVDILLGKADARIKNNGHEKLSTFGIGTDLSNAQWRNVFRQLVARRLLVVDADGYGALHLSKQCSAIFKGQESVWLRRYAGPTKTKTRGTSRPVASLIDLSERDTELYEALRDLRRTLADKQGVPPFVIFHDKSLQQMAKKRPANKNELSEINGVGAKKLEQYADKFLTIIKQNQKIAP